MIPDYLKIGPVTESDLTYLGGVCDSWGSIRIERPHSSCPFPLVEFKSPFLDKLEAIQVAAGGIGSLTKKAVVASGHSVRPAHFLRFRGAHYYQFENLVLPFIRVRWVKDQFAKNRERLAKLRNELGLASPFKLPTTDDQVARYST